MERKDDIVRYSAEQLRRVTSESDWAKVDATPQAEVERQADADDGPLPEGWEDTVVLGIPAPKRGVYLRLDPDVLDWFKDAGKGYQTRINRCCGLSSRAASTRPADGGCAWVTATPQPLSRLAEASPGRSQPARVDTLTQDDIDAEIAAHLRKTSMRKSPPICARHSPGLTVNCLPGRRMADPGLFCHPLGLSPPIPPSSLAPADGRRRR